MKLGTVTSIVLIIAIGGLIGYDIFAVVKDQTATISAVVFAAGHANPVLFFAMGYVMGHLTWGQKE